MLRTLRRWTLLVSLHDKIMYIKRKIENFFVTSSNYIRSLGQSLVFGDPLPVFFTAVSAVFFLIDQLCNWTQS